MSNAKRYVVKFYNKYSTGGPDRDDGLKCCADIEDAFVFTNAGPMADALWWATRHVELWKQRGKKYGKVIEL